jgi:hypothetical protein
MKMRQQVPSEGGTFLADYTAGQSDGSTSQSPSFEPLIPIETPDGKNVELTTVKVRGHRQNPLQNTIKKTALLFDHDFGFLHPRKWALPTFPILHDPSVSLLFNRQA